VQFHPITIRLTLVTLLFLAPAIEARAQVDGVQAHVRSVTGIAQMYVDQQSPAFAIKRNVSLHPGNIIETGLNGRVVISLSDGGLITVLPNSRVVLKDFIFAHTARELLEIAIGRVLVKIRHAGGKPNPYRLNSPTASIAVRGTEFIVDVLTDGDTVVVVREGQVEVWPRNNPGNKRLVTPGGKVIVRPGGDISSAFPGPGSELNGRARFNGTLEDDYKRSIDSIAQNSNEIPPVYFSAFADPHLDSLENPAYATEFKNAEGRLLLLPSVSMPYRLDEGGNSKAPEATKDKDPSRFDYSVSPQLTFYTPIPGTRLVIGGGASAARTRLQDLTDFEHPGFKYYDYQALKLNAFNLSFVAAYSLGESGRTSAGVSIDRLSGDGIFFNEYRAKADVFDDARLDNSNARFARTRLSFGLSHRFSESKKIGLYYRHGFSSSDQEDQYQRKYEDQFIPETSYPLSGKKNIATNSSELGARFRAQLTKRLLFGVEGSYLYERIRSLRETENQPEARDRYLARRARLGAGLGFFLTSRILLNVDVAGGLSNNTEPPENSSCSFCFNSQTTFASSPKSSRGQFVSAHAAIQTNVWRNLFLTASSLTTFRKGLITLSHNGVEYGFYDAYRTQLSNAGIGWNFKPDLAVEYLLSIDHSYRVPSHSIKLRYTFNLGITGEK
jgi:hypothetical protein